MPDPQRCPARASSKSTGNRLSKSIRGWIASFAVAFAILAPLRSAIADWNDVPTGSMEPTILPGDRIFVNKLAYGLRVPFSNTWAVRWDQPSPGEIVVFASPKDGTRLVKRVIAGPGDTVELRNNVLLINGIAQVYSRLPESSLESVPTRLKAGRVYASERLGGRSHAVASIPQITSARRSFGPVTVPPGQYFLMGDNRDNSADSRYFGFVDGGTIVGRTGAVAISVDPDRYYMPRFARWGLGLR
jgi:signal peptidase I